MALSICTWMWGDKYSPEYVNRLHRGLRRNLTRPFRFLLMTESSRDIALPFLIERYPIPDPDLCTKDCFARLRMFDPAWQKSLNLVGPIVCIDLDVVITGNCDQLFDRQEPLVVLQGANAANPCPYNCSVFMLWPGTNPEVWSEFSLEAAQGIPHYGFPDDQGWLHALVPGAAAWRVGPSSGIYAYRKPQWPPSDRLPADARIVAFPGRRDPSHFQHLGWVKEHWV